MSAVGFASAAATSLCTWFTTSTAPPTQPTNWFAQLHTGYPGAAGSSNISSVTTRYAITWAAAAAGAVASSNTQSWTAWGGSADVLSYISIWSLSAAGTFYDSIQLSATATMATGDTFQITAITITYTISA